MDTRLLILQKLDEICRSRDLDDIGDIQWEDGQLLRQCAISAERGDPNGWQKFISHLRTKRFVASGFVQVLDDLGWAEYSIEDDEMVLTLPSEFSPLSKSDEKDLLEILNPNFELENTLPNSRDEKLGVVMYIEEKPGLAGHARIGRVTFSSTRKTIYYAGRSLRTLKGARYKANYFDVDSGLNYWISKCKRGGNDTLYPGIVEIDDEAREEYWIEIRNMPENVHMTSYRSEGKYAKRRPS